MNCTDERPISALLLSARAGADECSRKLRSAGVDTLHLAFDERSALAVVQDQPIDVVVCDGDAGWAQSIGIASAVRSMPDEQRPFLPIIVLASAPSVQKEVAARNAGVHRVVEKRASPIWLGEELRGVLSRPPVFVRDGGYFGPIRNFCIASGSAAEAVR